MVSFANSMANSDAESSDEEEVSVINTFLHVGPRRSRTTSSTSNSCRTAPERILTAAAEAAVEFCDAEHVRETNEHGAEGVTGNCRLCQTKTSDSFETSSTAESQSDEEEKPGDKSMVHPQRENKQLLELSDLIEDSSTQRISASIVTQAPRVGMHVLPAPMSVVLVPSIVLQVPKTAATPSSPEPQMQVEHKTTVRKKPVASTVGPARLEKEVTGSGKECVKWIVDGRKLESNCNQLLSREFELDVPGAGPQPFKLMLHAKTSKARGGKGFQKVGGRSLLFLKCSASLPSTAGCLAVQVTVGRGSPTELSCSPIHHNFLDQNCCPLQQEGDWNLLQMVDRASKYFEISLEVLNS